MIYLSAGHNPKGLKPDPGAIGNGFKEANLTAQLRDLIIAECKALNVVVQSDSDSDNLVTVLQKINSNETDVVCDLHFNAGTASATGIEVLIPTRFTIQEQEIARKLTVILSSVLKIKNRGVKTEGDSQHGTLGIMREKGINILIEVCFISNSNDMNSYVININKVAKEIALLLIEAEGLIK